MRSILLLVPWLGVLTACGRDPQARDRRGDADAVVEQNANDEVPDAEPSPSPTPKVEPRLLTVELGHVALTTQRAYFFLGQDPATLIKYESGDAVVFEDVDLPKDLTVVVVDDATGDIAATTILGLDVRTIALHKNGASPFFTTLTEPHGPGWVDGRVAGGLSMAGLVGAAVRARGPGLSTQRPRVTGATFTLDAGGLIQGPLDVIAVGIGGTAAAFGFVRGVSVTQGGTTTADLTLDQPVNQVLTVTALNEAPYGGASSSRLQFFPAGAFKSADGLFSNRYDVTPVPGTPFVGSHDTPSFAGELGELVERRVSLQAGTLYAPEDQSQIDPAKVFGTAYVRVDRAASAVAPRLMDPISLALPALGTFAAPGAAAAADLTLQWSGDGEATATVATLTQVVESGAKATWTVYAPRGASGVTLPRLPLDVAGKDALPAGMYQVKIEQKSASSYKKHSDYFNVPVADEGDVGASQRRGYLTLD